MITFSLQSGSNGNAIYVEAGSVRLLFDAGISGRCAEGRLRVHRRDIRSVTAVIISHDHNDHVRCAGIYQRKFKLPIYITRRTHLAVTCNLGPLHDVRYFASGGALRFDGVTVHTIRTPHDAADGVAFVVEHDRRRLGILTDLGHPFPALREVVPELDGLYLESNYDPGLLAAGPYPAYLKERIRGQHGHLSNEEAAGVLSRAGRRLQWAALAHLSEQNNNPDLALSAHRRHLGRGFPLRLASRSNVSEILHV